MPTERPRGSKNPPVISFAEGAPIKSSPPIEREALEEEKKRRRETVICISKIGYVVV